MKIRYLFITGIVVLAGCASCNRSTQGNYIDILWEDEHQTIDGFGVSQAGLSHGLYAHYQREEAMESLFGEKGLRLNMVRGEIFPHYRKNETDTSFRHLSEDIYLPLNDPFFYAVTDEFKEIAQLWITKTAREKYRVEKLIFSAWSPPAYMKSGGKSSEGYASGGVLKPGYYRAFAEYLAEFYKAYESIGLAPYAISPSNEPGYPAPWNSCVWTAEEMGEFICEHLGPVFRQENIPAKIIFGENPLWSSVCRLAAPSSSLAFVETVLGKYPEIAGFNPIAAGHGYTLPEEFFPFKDSLDTPIVPFPLAEKMNIPVWMTEASTIDELDASLENGLYWAETIHTYLTVANVGAFVWWGGAVPTGNNECLIVLGGNREGYSLTKRFETFGNYTRYIPSGSKRIGVGNTHERLLVSAYKKGRDYTIVAVNNTGAAIEADINIKGEKAAGELKGYVTDIDNCWSHKIFPANKSNAYTVNIPSQSVMTFTGKVKR